MRGARVTLVNDANYLLYTPLLPGAAGATLDPRHVLVPLREQLRHTDLLVGSVSGLGRRGGASWPCDGSTARRCARLRPAAGRAGVDLARAADTGPGRARDRAEVARRRDGAAQQAARLPGHRRVARGGLQRAPSTSASFSSAPATRAWRAWPSCRTSLRRRSSCIHAAAPRACAGCWSRRASGSSRRCRRACRRSRRASWCERGIEIRTRHDAATRSTRRGATLSDGERVAARTVVWTAGVRPAPAVAALGLPLDDGRPDRRPTSGCASAAHPGVWAIGDCAAVPDPARPGQACPPTAQHAIRQGRLAAHNIAAALGGGRSRPFRYRTAGVVAELGRGKAVAITLGVRWRGLPAWIIARTYHLLLMPGVGRKLRLLVDWNVALLFGRDTPRRAAWAAPTPAATAERLAGRAAPEGRTRYKQRPPRAAYPERRMAISEQVQQDLKDAMRAGEKQRVGRVAAGALRAAEGRQGGRRRRAGGAAARAQAPRRGGAGFP